MYDRELSKCGSLPGGDTGDGSKINRRQYRELFSPEGKNTYLNDS